MRDVQQVAMPVLEYENHFFLFGQILSSLCILYTCRRMAPEESIFDCFSLKMEGIFCSSLVCCTVYMWCMLDPHFLVLMVNIIE